MFYDVWGNWGGGGNFSKGKTSGKKSARYTFTKREVLDEIWNESSENSLGSSDDDAVDNDNW